MPEQKRELTRYRFDDQVDVYDRRRNLWLGRLVNLHEKGLMITGDQAMEQDKIYVLELHLMQPLAGRGCIAFEADCLWTRPADQDDLHWTGLSILECSEQASTDLARLIERLGHSDPA